jgi:hypothetical protein
MQHTILAFALGVLVVQAALPNKKAFSDTSDNKNSDVCIAQYAPTQCHGVYGGDEYLSTGSNMCWAIHKMVRDINNAYLWFMEVEAADIQKLTCTEITMPPSYTPNWDEGVDK